MTRDEAVRRLARAEAEYQTAQLEHDGSDRATVRYQAARSALVIAERIAKAVLESGA